MILRNIAEFKNYPENLSIIATVIGSLIMQKKVFTEDKKLFKIQFLLILTLKLLDKTISRKNLIYHWIKKLYLLVLKILSIKERF